MEAGRDVVLSAHGVGKLYARRDATMRKRLVNATWRALLGLRLPSIENLAASEFWALNDISFVLERGRALGIIGLNGSGKTTLLRILAGQVLPDCGEVRVAGTSAAMIDLQAGFQPGASGRENIYLRAAALGLRHDQTEAMADEIIAFAEIGDAIDAPMSTYSAGMKMRLAFSVMAMVQPDILLIDEVLAVGDFRFRQKCLARIRAMRARSAFILVSHSMHDISHFCDHAIVLHKGRVHFAGAPKEAIEIYESLDADTVTSETSQLQKAMGPSFQNSDVLQSIDHFWCDSSGKRTDRVEFGAPLNLRIQFRSTIDFRRLTIGVPVWNMNSYYTTGLSTEITHDRFDVKAGELIEVQLEVDGGVINPGTIKSMLSILDGTEYIYRQANPDLMIGKADHPTWGAVTIPHRWRRIENGSAASD